MGGDFYLATIHFSENGTSHDSIEPKGKADGSRVSLPVQRLVLLW